MGVVGGVFASRDVSERQAVEVTCLKSPQFHQPISLALSRARCLGRFCNLKRREKIRIVLG